MGRMPLWLLTAWLATGATAAAPTSRPTVAAPWFGPRITAVGPLTLRQAVDRIGRQLNRRMQLPWGPAGDTTATLDLREASPTAALAALQEAYGCRLRRPWRWGYQVELGPAPAAALGQPLPPPLDGWTVWLQAMRATFTSSVQSLERAAAQRQAALTPSLAIQTQSDAEGLRIVSCGPVHGVTPDGLELRPLDGDQKVRWNRSTADPSVWLLEQSLAPPPRGVARLATLTFELQVVGLSEHRFSFALRDHGQTQSDAALDVTLDSAKGARDLRLTVRGQGLGGARAARLQEAMLRDAGIDARLYAADGQPLYTHCAAVDTGENDQLWRVVQAIRLVEDDPKVQADRLDLRIYLPSPQVEAYRVTFRDVPLPPLP